MNFGVRIVFWFFAFTLLLHPAWRFGSPSSAYAFHFPWDQGHDTFDPDPGDDDNDPGDDACPANTCCLNTKGASPVEFASGNFIYNLRLLRLKGLGPEIDITLTYNSRDNRKGPFGHGWVFEYDQRLIETTDGVNVYAVCTKSNGKRERFFKTPEGGYTPPPYIFDTITKNGDGTFTVRAVDGMRRHFNSAGQLADIVDRNGNNLNFSYDETGFIRTITDASCHSGERA